MLTINSGFASKAPNGPHSHAQKAMARKTIIGFTVSVRPMMLGVTICPSSVETHRKQAGAIQGRLGAAIVQVTLAQTGSVAVRAMQQEHLGSLLIAAIRAEPPVDRPTFVAATVPQKNEAAAVSAEPVSWPEIPMGYLMIAGFLLVTIFFGGLSWAAQGREKKALAEMRHDASRWVYRIAA